MNKNKLTYQGKGTVKTKDAKSVTVNTKATPLAKGKREELVSLSSVLSFLR